jgi:outer membrane protein OmpA-like peptidoglycan-associated protein
MLLAFAGLSAASMAQNDTELKYSVATNSFWSNWFVSADVAYEAFYSNEEKGRDYAKSPLKDFRRNLGASVAIGKWFTPGIGLRTKFTGIWGRNVISTDAETNAIKFWNLQEQVMFNLSNLFCGYNENRVWNLIPYAGVGVLRNCDMNEYCHGVSLGLLNTWKLSKHVALNFDLGFNLSDDDYDGELGHDIYGNSIAKSDRYFTAEVGLTFNLGKANWKKTPDVDAIKRLMQSEIDGLNDQLRAAGAENDRLNNVIKNHKCPEAKTITVKEITAAPLSIFFDLGKSKITSKKDLINLEQIAKVAKEQNKTLVVEGYADSKTGNSKLNQKLTESRAETVKAELVKLGVDASKIETKGNGGVNELSPIQYNRRAVVSVK